jgi:Lipopolysaccharide-assembly
LTYSRNLRARAPVLALTLSCLSCGYHVSGKGDLLPKTLHTIAIPAFSNVTVRYRLTDRLPEALAREFIARTRYQVIPDANQADAVLHGAVTNYVSYPTVFDQRTGRASGLQVSVTMQVTLVERATGKVLFSRPSFEMKQRYEFSIAPQAYFDESDTAVDRLSRDVARDVVSAILESF